MDALNKLAINFSRANTQEQIWLRDEIKELRTMLAILIQRAGGQVSISHKNQQDMYKRVNAMGYFDHVQFESYEDQANRATIIRVREQCPKCDGSGTQKSLCTRCNGA